MLEASGQQDMERGVLGGGADGARVHGGLAREAEAQVPAREQQHARVATAAGLARRRRGPGHRVVGDEDGRGGLEAAGLRVLRLGAVVDAWAGQGAASGLQIGRAHV